MYAKLLFILIEIFPQWIHVIIERQIHYKDSIDRNFDVTLSLLKYLASRLRVYRTLNTQLFTGFKAMFL
jgi:hypothetical protein